MVPLLFDYVGASATLLCLLFVVIAIATGAGAQTGIQEQDLPYTCGDLSHQCPRYDSILASQTGEPQN
jgi:hypothetical protein